MAIANEDGLVVDLMLGKVSTRELRSSGVRTIDVDRVDAMNRLIRLMHLAPEQDPPAQLLERTLARIQKIPLHGRPTPNA